MNTAKTEKSHVFRDKRGQDRRQDTERAKKFKNNRRKRDRRNMEFNELPWWLQRGYVDVDVNITRPPAKPKNRLKQKQMIKAP